MCFFDKSHALLRQDVKNNCLHLFRLGQDNQRLLTGGAPRRRVKSLEIAHQIGDIAAQQLTIAVGIAG